METDTQGDLATVLKLYTAKIQMQGVPNLSTTSPLFEQLLFVRLLNSLKYIISIKDLCYIHFWILRLALPWYQVLTKILQEIIIIISQSYSWAVFYTVNSPLDLSPTGSFYSFHHWHVSLWHILLPSERLPLLLFSVAFLLIPQFL